MWLRRETFSGGDGMNNLDALTKMFIALDKMPYSEYDDRVMKELLEKGANMHEKLIADIVDKLPESLEDVVVAYLDQEGLTDLPQIKYARDYYPLLDAIRKDQAININKWFWVVVPGNLKASGRYDEHIEQLRALGTKWGYFSYLLRMDGTEYVAYLQAENPQVVYQAARAIAGKVADTKEFLAGCVIAQRQFHLHHSHAESMSLYL